MTTCLGKSCSFGLPRVPFVICCQFMYLVISLLVLRAGCGFLITAYFFTLQMLLLIIIILFQEDNIFGTYLLFTHNFIFLLACCMLLQLKPINVAIYSHETTAELTELCGPGVHLIIKNVAQNSQCLSCLINHKINALQLKLIILCKSQHETTHYRYYNLSFET